MLLFFFFLSWFFLHSTSKDGMWKKESLHRKTWILNHGFNKEQAGREETISCSSLVFRHKHTYTQPCVNTLDCILCPTSHTSEDTAYHSKWADMAQLVCTWRLYQSCPSRKHPNDCFLVFWNCKFLFYVYSAKLSMCIHGLLSSFSHGVNCIRKLMLIYFQFHCVYDPWGQGILQL